MASPARYRIVRKIADGGMAEIFLATQHGAEGFERPVIVKRILQALLADPQFRNMMIDEAHIAMSLTHSNIAQVLDLGQVKGRYFLVLELVDGWDLNHILNRIKGSTITLPPEIALYLCAEVCRALGYAHARTRDGKPLGIVHRDISPHNVLISEQGEVKLTDFGIAKALGRRERTGQGVIKGKLAFMSPEQAAGAPLDARSDLFSVGTMLYLLTTGRRPFEAPTDLEAILRVQQCKFPAPTEVKPDIAPKLAAIIAKAMDLTPSQRYQTAEEFLGDLETAQRTVFQPAGQTELKRWLAELGKKDNLPPISRMSPAPGANSTETLDLEGADLVFEELAGEPTVASKTGKSSLRPASATPPPVPLARRAPAEQAAPTAIAATAASPTAAPGDGTSAPVKLATGSGKVKRLAVVAALAGAVAILAVRSRPKPDAASTATNSDPSATAPPPSTAAPPIPPNAATPAEPPTLAPVPPAPSEPPAPQEPPSAVTPPSPTPSIEPTPEEDEEALLKRKVANPTETVIGEAEGEPPPPAKVAATKRSLPAATPAKPDAKSAPAAKPTAITTVAREPETVSVHVVSKPVGAVIKIKDRVFGPAPMNLRFRSGITYDLSFVKTGYISESKRFTVSRRKNQQIAVTLKKKAGPPQKKGFLRRLFGG